ncbi:hypothetical protein TL16_g11431 [Triparma laevis f. inornata]|uniref:Amino acid transporter transmembrane domain-containing protein n=1 Tax=Triparma laevis f. inornata TaxID=1714386 RepID=A0A9W7EQN9_9STRA|nr:hypothetical protein TL16_g11431 [Triparma laevis f. inornata]
MPSSMFNLANAIVGAGVLTLPFAIKSTGLILGLTLLLLFALLSSYSLLLLDSSCRITGAKTYAELGRVVYGGETKEEKIAGERIEYAVEVLQSLYSYGACVGYLQIVVSELVVVTGYSGRFLLLLCCLCVVFPLSLMKNLQSLSFTSFLGSGSVVDAAFGKGLFTSLPIFCFAFNCQVQFLPLVAELKGGREEGGETKVLCLIFGVMCGVCGLYCLDASVGYLSFCEDTLNNILDCYGEDDVLIKISRIGFVVTLMFSFPLYSTAVVTSVHSLTSSSSSSRGLSFGRRISLATIIVGSMAVIVSFDPPLDAVLGLTGAIGGCSLVYVFPGLFYCRAVRKMKGGGGNGRGGGEVALALVLAIGGGLLGVSCTFAILIG